MLLDANEPYNLHLNKLAYRLAIGCYLTRKTCGYTLVYSVGCAHSYVAEDEGEPQGLPFCVGYCGFDD